MADELAVRIGYRLKFVEDPQDYRLLVECRDALILGPSVTQEQMDAELAMLWLEANGFSLTKAQKEWFAERGVE